MNIKIKLYAKVQGLLNIINGWLNVRLVGYRNALAEVYADNFLKKFRSVKEDPNNFSIMERASLNPRCRHLKGGNVRGVHKDYNLICHNYPDGTTKIWCGYNCGFVARPGDANWKEAVNMMSQSSNSISSSERVFYKKGVMVVPSVEIVTYQDKLDG